MAKFPDCAAAIGCPNVTGEVAKVALCCVDKEGVVLPHAADILDPGNSGNRCAAVDSHKVDVEKVEEISNCATNGAAESLKD